MFDFLTQESFFIENLKEQFKDLHEAQLVDTFLNSKYIKNEEIVPAMFLEHERLNNSEFFKSIGKSVYNRFRERYFSFVNDVFSQLLDIHLTLEQISDPNTLKTVTSQYKEKIGNEPLFSDFFNDIVPNFLEIDSVLNTNIPLKLAQLVRQCDYYDAILLEMANEEQEEKIGWVYELSSLFFENLCQSDLLQEADLVEYVIDQHSNDSFIFPSNFCSVEPILLSELIYSGRELQYCIEEINTAYGQICAGQKNPVFVRKKLTAKYFGGTSHAKEEDSNSSIPAA